MVKIAFLPEIIALHKIVIKYCHQDQVLSSILLQGVNIVVRTKYCHQNQILSDIERKSVIVPGFSESNLSAPFLPHHGTIPDKLDTILIQFWYNSDRIPPALHFWTQSCNFGQNAVNCLSSLPPFRPTQYFICSCWRTQDKKDLMQKMKRWQYWQHFFAGVGPDGTKYKTAYKCEGEKLTISCASDQTIKVTK